MNVPARRVVLDASDISRSVTRIAHEILEDSKGLQMWSSWEFPIVECT